MSTPCWNCQKPVPGERLKLSPVKRVFCSDECERAFHAFHESRELAWLSEELRLNRDGGDAP